MKEASFYHRAEAGAVNCFLCGHRCRIADGRRGFCQARENRGGTLLSLVYGRAIAEHVDPIEKKPLYHFLPGSLSYSIATPGCNFRCSFCQNWQISQTERGASFDRIRMREPAAIVRAATDAGARSISYTYTEPTIFMEYALDCAALAREAGLANVFVTNGYQTPEAIESMRGAIDAANVDLKAFSEDFYRSRCQGKLAVVLEAIAALHAAGIHIEVTTLLIPGENDDEEQLRGIAKFLAGISTDITWHISRFHPDYQLLDVEATPLESMERAGRAGAEAGLKYVYQGNVVTRGGQDTFCPGCRERLIERRGVACEAVHIAEPRCPKCGTAIPIIF